MSELYIPEEDADYLRCLQYVIDVEIENNHIEVFAERLQISTRTATKWRQQWIESGLLAAVRRQMALGPLEDMKAAKLRAVQRFPAVLERWIDIAENGKSDRNAFEAAKALWQEIIKPMMDEAPDAGSEEASFIKGHLVRRVDPMAISREIKRGETPTSLPSTPEQTSDTPAPLGYSEEEFGLFDNEPPESEGPSDESEQ